MSRTTVMTVTCDSPTCDVTTGLRHGDYGSRPVTPAGWLHLREGCGTLSGEIHRVEDGIYRLDAEVCSIPCALTLLADVAENGVPSPH